MKKIFLLTPITIMSFLCLSSPSFASVYIKYSNHDDQKHEMTVQMDGSTKKVTFNSRTSGAATIQGSGKDAVIETSCGKVEVKDDAKIEIKNGCVKVL